MKASSLVDMYTYVHLHARDTATHTGSTCRTAMAKYVCATRSTVTQFIGAKI
jgi:hypothetical protein